MLYRFLVTHTSQQEPARESSCNLTEVTHNAGSLENSSCEDVKVKVRMCLQIYSSVPY